MLHKFYKNLLFFITILMLLIKICMASVDGFIKHKGGIVSFADLMETGYFSALDKVKEDVLDNPNLTPEDSARIVADMASTHALLPADNKNVHKMQQVIGKNGKQFTVGIMGYGNVLHNFVKADKSSVDSLKSLADLLEQVHIDSAVERAERRGEEEVFIKPHEFLVSDGKDIYGIQVGRYWGPRKNGTLGKLKAWRQGRGDAEEDDPRAPKIIKKRGNVHVQGFFAEQLEQDLKQHFEGRKRFGFFGKRMPVKMDSDGIKRRLISALKKHSKYVTNSNPVSASFLAYFQNSKGKKGCESMREFHHRDLEEEEKLKIKQRRSPDKVIERLVRKKFLGKEVVIKQNEKWLWSMYFDALSKIGREEMGLKRRSSMSSTSSDRGGGRGFEHAPAIPTHIDGPRKKLTKKSRNF